MKDLVLRAKKTQLWHNVGVPLDDKIVVKSVDKWIQENPVHFRKVIFGKDKKYKYRLSLEAYNKLKEKLTTIPKV